MAGRGAGPGRPPKSFLKGRRGRITKRTPGRVAVITTALENGHTRSAAAALAGIHRSTLYEWVNDDPKLAEALDLAEAKAEAAIAEALRNAATRDWKAAITWLEHRRRVDWKPPTVSTEVSGPDGGPVELATVRERLASVLDGYAAQAGAGRDPGQPDDG